MTLGAEHYIPSRVFLDSPTKEADLDAEIRQSILESLSKQNQKAVAPVFEDTKVELPPVYLDRAYLAKLSQRRITPHSAPTTVHFASSNQESQTSPMRHEQKDEGEMDAHTQALLQSHLLRLRQHQARLFPQEEENVRRGRDDLSPVIVVSPSTAPHGNRPTVRFAQDVSTIALSPLPDDDTPSRTVPASPRANYGLADYLTFGLFARNRNKEKAKHRVESFDEDSMEGFDDMVDIEDGEHPVVDGRSTVPRSAILVEGSDVTRHAAADDIIIDVEPPTAGQQPTSALTPADHGGLHQPLPPPSASESRLRSSPNRLAKSVKNLVSSVFPTRSSYQPMAHSRSEHHTEMMPPTPTRQRAETEPTMTSSAEVSKRGSDVSSRAVHHHRSGSLSSVPSHMMPAGPPVFESAPSLLSKSGVVVGLSGKSISLPSTPKRNASYQRFIDDAVERRGSRASDPVLMPKDDSENQTFSQARRASNEIINFMRLRGQSLGDKLNVSNSSLSYVELDDDHQSDNDSPQESKRSPDLTLQLSPDSPSHKSLVPRLSPKPSPRSSLTGGRPPSSFPRNLLLGGNGASSSSPKHSPRRKPAATTTPATRSTSMSMPMPAPMDLSSSSPTVETAQISTSSSIQDIPPRPFLPPSSRSSPVHTAQIHPRPQIQPQTSTRKLPTPIISPRGRSKEPRSPMNVHQLNRSQLRQGVRGPKSTTTTRRSAFRNSAGSIRSKTPPPASSPFSIMGHLRNASALLSTAGFLAASSSGESTFYPGAYLLTVVRFTGNVFRCNSLRMRLVHHHIPR